MEVPLFFVYSVIFFVSAHRRHSRDTAVTPPVSTVLSPPPEEKPTHRRKLAHAAG